ncbi:MAG: GAF domain-containing sensor histidine kinase [Nostoc sp. DedVER02]|uniref:GAF domain-containing sensor histidine kinase n=1 Tax=unclassified Nostoc TaxID=2593658 RepID=UPI002AD51414|nr:MULTISPECIES: GAF domain-containing sensor histidine kinase [unclassified Nostoc]MDZ7986665.1 GAF domain-containing sensor histidine kinase [Nostoc sp. DedVER02]MDZ8112382.1 GAF domain-containing sensor histidine kinase [Nostoc sp. DedVER01b]
MLSSSDLSFSRTLPIVVFNQLGELLEQMAQRLGSATLVLTEDVLARIYIPVEWQRQRFTLVVSEQFSTLLLGNFEQGEQGEQLPTQDGLNHSYPLTGLNAKLTFNLEAIASFMHELRDLFECDSYTHQNLESYRQIIRPNDATLQSQFTLLLLEYLLTQPNQEIIAPPSPTAPSVYICQPVEDALKKQIYQERLLNQVTTQIRKSLDLDVIMATAVTQVREFLELDRLVIYKFEDSKVSTQQYQSSTQEGNNKGSISISVNNQCSLEDYQRYGGYIVYEARATDAIISVLNYTEKNCFMRTSQCWEKYRQGFILAVDDVEKSYALEECLLNFLRESQVRAKLAAPIIFEEKLWGLLIAHQCNKPRQWSDSEKSLLTSIAEQLAIAIHQAELMQTLTQEKQTLEQRVIERTIGLRDALLAAEAASRLRSEFLATISHELLTPLTYVIGMSSTLLRWPFGELSQRQRDYLQKIHDSGEHLLGMINDILDLSQIEAGKTALNISEFSLVNVAENAIESLRNKAISEQINLNLDLQIDPRRDRFIADAKRVEQILWNLLTNAIKFTPESGSVTLRLWVEDDTAIFQVEDTGIGIREEQLPLLFEKFQQLDTPYRRRYEGTGLGLALTKQLVELHRGRIEVESTISIGSIFTVWIPTQALTIQNSKFKIQN